MCLSPELIYLHGNNKSTEELSLAIESGCTIVVDNWHELHTLANLAGDKVDKGELATSHQSPATRIMLQVHNHGVGECGVVTYEVAETKVAQVMDFARQHQHPLQCVMEKK